jgi:hypothetical protein
MGGDGGYGRPRCKALPRGLGAHPERFEKVLEAPCPFHGGQTKHLLKDYAMIRGYIHSILGQQGKVQKPAPKAAEPVDAAPEDDTDFPKADCCLMIFGGLPGI